MSRVCDCPLNRQIEVPYMGSGRSGVMFVGESPGREEERRLRPFQGESGKMLWGACQEARFDVSDARVCNSARCLIDKNALTTGQQKDVLAACRGFLEKDIKILKPKLIILLGDFALRQVTKAGGITKKRGQLMWSKEFNTWCLPTFHPAYILRNRDLRPYLVEDMSFAKRFARGGFKEENISHRTTKTKVVSSLDPLIAILQNSKTPVQLALDTETQGFDFVDPNSFVISFSMSWNDKTAIQVFLYDAVPSSIFHFIIQDGKKPKNKQRRVLSKISKGYLSKLKGLRAVIEHPNTRLIMQNGNYDMHHLLAEYRRAKLKPPSFKQYVLDLQAGAHLINENRNKSASLEQMRASFLNEPSNWKKRFYEVVDPTNMIAAPRDMITEYAGEDANSTLRIGKVIISKIREDKKLARYLQRMSMPVISRALFTLEENGVFFDHSAVPRVSKKVGDIVLEKYSDAMVLVPSEVKEVHAEKGLSFTRRDFIADILYSSDGFDLEPLSLTKSGKGSTDAMARLQLIESRKTPAKARQFLVLFDEWSQWAGVASKGIKGLEKHIRSDGRIHTSYSLVQAVTGRASCLHKNTAIYVLDDREKVLIKDVKPGDWLWSFDAKGKPIPQKVRRVFNKGLSRDLVRVKYLTQGSRKTKSIVCTSDHRFMLRDGSYVNANKLCRGHRLMAIERNICKDRKEYRRMWFTGKKGEIREHCLVNKLVNGSCGRHVHHKNECSTDNRPINLEALSVKQHMAKHPQSDDTRTRISETMKELYRSGKKVVVGMKLEKHPRWQPLDRDWCISVLYCHAGRPTVFRDLYGMDYTCVLRKLKMMGVDWRSIKERFDKHGKFIDDNRLERAKKATTFGEARRILQVGKPKTKRLISGDNNHMVVSVTKLTGKKASVYDLEIDGHPNFIANGVCVHNSSRPNVMAMPKRSDAAKATGELIAAEDDDHVLIECDLSQAELRYMAHESQDKNMIQVYRKGEDIHTNTAKALSSKPWDSMTDEEKKQARTNSKAGNFGLLYGMSAPGFVAYCLKSYKLKVSMRWAENYIENWFSTYPSVRAFHVYMSELVEQDKEVRSMYGRIRHLPDIESRNWGVKNEAIRMAINFPIQSAASDHALFSLAYMLDKGIVDNKDCRPVLFIHDAIVFSCKRSKAKRYAEVIKETMEQAPIDKYFGIHLDVPIVADAQIGPNRSKMVALEEWRS